MGGACFLLCPFSGCVCTESSPPLAQADLPPEHRDHQDDDEAAQHPQVLDQEEDHLGGGVGRVLGYALHLRELWGGTGNTPSLARQAESRWQPLPLFL